MKAFMYYNFTTSFTSIHGEHCMARQNLLLSPCETAKGKPPLMKGVGWFKEFREWQDFDTLE